MQSVHPQETGAGTSIRERMAMLQLDQVARAPASPTRTNSGPRLPPRPPPRPAPSPSPTAAKPVPPPLPRRKTSRSSLAESVVSVASTSSNNSFGSNATTRSLPPVYTGKESLPVQFPDKKKPDIAPARRVNSLPSWTLSGKPAEPARPPLPVRRTTTLIHPPLRGGGGREQLPQRLPLRGVGGDGEKAPHRLPLRGVDEDGEKPPNRLPFRSADENGEQKLSRRLPPLPARSAENAPAAPGRPRLPASHTESEISGPPPIPRSTRPPPVPVSSRPSFSAPCAPESPLPCLICYDFSGPDCHAGLPQFHRSRVTSLRSLALALTEPFPSALDKARALFTWLHHNISYDVRSFFASSIPSQQPESTLQSGLAVCAGYAELFSVLARHGGLEAVVVGGHGKGYGHSDKAGPPPPFQGNHAWNAVKLAPNYWHLIDACWGAGHIQGPPTPGYTAKLAPENFISPPSVFGRRHFPENPRLQHREDGRIISWEEYMAPEVERPRCFAQFAELFNFSKETIAPAAKNITGGRRERFAVSLPCQHLPVIRPEDEYVLFLNVGSEFDVKNFYLLEPDGTGRGFECVVDIPRGCAKVTLYYPINFDGREGKGLGREYFKKRVGKCGWSWSPVVEWGSD